MNRLALALFLFASAPALAQDTSSEAAAEEEAGPRLARIDARLALRVDDREASLDAAVAAAKARGGWFSSLSEQSVTVRVPIDAVEAYIEEMRELGDVVERSFESQDLTSERDELATRLASREALLAKYLEVLETAHAGAVVGVEREISNAITQIESMKGRLRVVEDRAAFGEIVIGFQYRDRQAPTRDGTSSFAWLNTVNMADLLYDFEVGSRESRSVLAAQAPAGFAPYERPGRFQALSPDNVAFRVRSAKNEPVADLPFWKEALRTRMSDAGYHVEKQTDITSASGQAGYLLELGAANGEQDQAYAVGLFVVGRKLVIVEASGEAEKFAAHRDAVVAAIKGM